MLKNFQNILGKLKDVEQELEAIGDNMKQLEISAEKAQEREEKLVDKIHTLMERLKVAEARFEYGEMNVSKLNLRYTNYFHSTSHTSCRQNNMYEKWGYRYLNGFDVKIIVKSNAIKNKNKILGPPFFMRPLPFDSQLSFKVSKYNCQSCVI